MMTLWRNHGTAPGYFASGARDDKSILGNLKIREQLGQLGLPFRFKPKVALQPVVLFWARQLRMHEHVDFRAKLIRRISAWGYNSEKVPCKVDCVDGLRIRSVAAGNEHTMLLSDGTVMTAGYNDNGRCGRGYGSCGWPNACEGSERQRNPSNPRVQRLRTHAGSRPRRPHLLLWL